MPKKVKEETMEEIYNEANAAVKATAKKTAKVLDTTADTDPEAAEAAPATAPDPAPAPKPAVKAAPAAKSADGISEKDILQFADQCKNIFTQLSRDMVGQKEVVDGTIIAMIAGGNVLLEGAPGVGKTRLVRSLGRVFDLPFSRIQFTPDLMPADVTGTNIIVKDEKGNSKFQFQQGPIFANIVLADEINRATPKTQSALLEAMQEHTVTVMGVSRKLNEPFFVLATQNPIEQDGTYPLPEAQMDRFVFKLIVNFPSETELENIVNLTQATMGEVAEAACNAEQLLKMRATSKQILIAEDVMNYAMRLVVATHPDGEFPTKITKKYIRFGASPRAGQALISCAKVRALMNGRFNVSYNDINELSFPILRHRLKPSFEAITEHITTDDIVAGIIKEVSASMGVPYKPRTGVKEINLAPEPTGLDSNQLIEIPDDGKKKKKNK